MRKLDASISLQSTTVPCPHSSRLDCRKQRELELQSSEPRAANHAAQLFDIRRFEAWRSSAQLSSSWTLTWHTRFLGGKFGPHLRRRIVHDWGERFNVTFFPRAGRSLNPSDANCTLLAMVKGLKQKPDKASTGPRSALSAAKLQQEADVRADNEFSNLQKEIQTQFRGFEHERKQSRKSNARGTAGREISMRNGVPAHQGSRGQKRDHHGGLKKSGRSTEANVDRGQPHAAVLEDETLQEELRALGGTEEDLELIKGVASESELEGENNASVLPKPHSKTKSSLQDGISNILKEISLAQDRDRTSPKPSSVSGDGNKLPQDKKHKSAYSQPDQLSVKPDRPATKQSKFICVPRPDWYNTAVISTEDANVDKHTLPLSTLRTLQDYAMSLLKAENERFRKQTESSSTRKFYNTVIASGTLSDKISALTLAVQESPLHNMGALENLIGLARKRSRSQVIDVLRALKDLFAQGSLLPSDRRLYAFSSQPALLRSSEELSIWRPGLPLPPGLEEKHFVRWAFESWLKEQFFEILKILELWCNDEIDFSRSKTISYVFELLKEKPEQEANLLRLLINKLGDPVKKIASQTSYLIMQLVAAHPAMKGIVVSAIGDDFIFRPRQSLHAKYYAVVTLNQTILSNSEENVVMKLLEIYFGLFTELLKQHGSNGNTESSDVKQLKTPNRNAKRPGFNDNKRTDNDQADELREKLISAILTGVNRAYPYTDGEGQALSSHLDTLFQITHSSNFNTSVQAMLLIQQLSASHYVATDRFYRTLYESLLDPRLPTSSKQQLYLNLLHRALKADTSLNRIRAFYKRILQVLTLHQPPFVCGAFFLLQDLERNFPSLSSLTELPEDDADDVELFRDAEDEQIDSNRRQTTKIDSAHRVQRYDGRKRDPEHSHAENSCGWELLPFLNHFHPSVSVSARHLLSHEKLSGTADLTLHTLIHFLDRFVYRNPKTSSFELKGSSIMQPMASDTQAVLISARVGSKRHIPVNSEEFRLKTADQVDAEDVFFHRYFTSAGKEPPQKKNKPDRMANDQGSIGSEDEDEVWKAMMTSAPDLEGSEDSDQDLRMSDLESDFDAEDTGAESGEGLEGVEGSIFDESDAENLDGEGSDLADTTISSEEAKAAEQQPNPSVAGKSTNGSKRRRTRQLPVFASASEYAQMLEDDADEDIG